MKVNRPPRRPTPCPLELKPKRVTTSPAVSTAALAKSQLQHRTPGSMRDLAPARAPAAWRAKLPTRRTGGAAAAQRVSPDLQCLDEMPHELRAAGTARPRQGIDVETIGDDDLAAVRERPRRRRAVGQRGHVVELPGHHQRRHLGVCAHPPPRPARPGGSPVRPANRRIDRESCSRAACLDTRRS